MVEGRQNLGVLSEDNALFLANFPPEAKRRVIRKIDACVFFHGLNTCTCNSASS